MFKDQFGGSKEFKPYLPEPESDPQSPRDLKIKTDNTVKKVNSNSQRNTVNTNQNGRGGHTSNKSGAGYH